MPNYTYITEPTVYLMAQPNFNRLNMALFLKEEVPDNKWLPSPEAKDGEAAIEMAGRVCYMSFESPRPGGTGAYIKHLKEVGHGSVLEHPVYSFLITGISRSLSHELVRHRAGWAYSQLSQRYVVEEEGRFVVPDEYQSTGPASDLLLDWKQGIEREHGEYVSHVAQVLDRLKTKMFRGHQQMFKLTFGARTIETWWKELPQELRTSVLKRARQAARSKLPNATETKIYATANVRAIRHFLEQRGAEAADSEIRKLANKILDVVKPTAPYLFGDYTRSQVEGSYPGDMAISTPYRKV